MRLSALDAVHFGDAGAVFSTRIAFVVPSIRPARAGPYHGYRTIDVGQTTWVDPLMRRQDRRECTRRFRFRASGRGFEDSRRAMPSLREFFFGPWRAVAVLGVTQILAWGAIFYTAGADGAADRGGARLFLHLRDGRIFRRPARRGARRRRRVGSLIDRYGGHRVMPFGSLAGAARAGRAHLCEPSGRLLRDLDAARRRDGGLALRSGLRDARAHLRRQGAPADHGADARGRLRLDGELAGDLRAAAAARLEGHLSVLCRRCSPSSRRRCTPSRCRARAPTPTSSRPKAHRRRRRRAPATRRRLPAAGRGVRVLRVRPVRACRRICSRSFSAPGSMPARSC